MQILNGISLVQQCQLRLAQAAGQITSLSLSDSRLYEAAEVLKTSKLRAFFTITIPGARYGIIHH